MSPTELEADAVSEEEEEDDDDGDDDASNPTAASGNGIPTVSRRDPSFADRLLASSRPTTRATSTKREREGGGGERNEDGEEEENASEDAFVVVLDDAMESGESSSSSSSSNQKRCGFCDELVRELGPFLENLKPGRTKGDQAPGEILNRLRSMGTGGSKQKPSVSTAAPAPAESNEVRGDRSLFISREYRERPGFAAGHPRLHELISIVTDALQQQHHHHRHHHRHEQLELDVSMTSVQLARYPGDSKSGYLKHCDRHHSCTEERAATETEGGGFGGDGGGGDDNTNSSSRSRSSGGGKSGSAPERLVTCIYYLTDKDWDVKLDGGALRVFRPGVRSATQSPYDDIPPFRDRMVVFRSDRIQHQVLPSHRRPRLAITMWFYGNAVAAVPPKQRQPQPQPQHRTSTTTTTTTIPGVPLRTGETASTKPKAAATAAQPVIAKPVSRGPVPLPVYNASGTARGKPESSSSTEDELPTVFVSIASYRDSETVPTIESLYDTALKPQRIVCGIVVQLEDGAKDDEAIWKGLDTSQPPNGHHHRRLRVMRIRAEDATGPCYARGLCQTLWRGEDYVLQIDSHMRFRPNWDEYLIQTVEGLRDRRRRKKRSAIAESDDETGPADDPNEGECDKIVLTTYPVGYALPDDVPNETRGTYLLPWKFDSEGMLRQKGRLFRRSTEASDHHHHPDGDANDDEDDQRYPPSVLGARRHLLFAGGFNFAPSRVLEDVPYDTTGLHHVFFGEEPTMAVRCFTHGYDLYAPEESVCYHLWSRAHRPSNPSTASAAPSDSAATTERRRRRLRETSRAKVRALLRGDAAWIGHPTGLGTSRTAAEFADRLGVDFERSVSVRDGWDEGRSQHGDEFVGDDPVADGGEDAANASRPVPNAGSTEARVAGLGSDARALIGMFLRGIEREPTERDEPKKKKENATTAEPL